MAKINIQDIRNVALVGHGAGGKTTLADLLLFKAGVGTRAGSVDEGSSLLDTDDDEKEHKYSISSALAHIEHKGKRINLIDTPGYPEFIGQAIGALRAVETAVVVINAGAGIEVNTRRTFARAGAAGVGRMVLINRLDHENVDYGTLLGHIQETFGAACVPLNVPVGAGHDFSAVVSTLKVPADVPAGVQADPKALNQTVMDAIVEADEELMVRYLEGEELSLDEVSGGVAKAIAAGTLIPVFCTSCKSGAGVD
jgi:elongation factor G